MKQLLNQALKISILILAVSFLGCDDDDIPDPEVLPGFTYTLNEDTGTVTFINISENSRNYFWTFGDGASSTEINPIKTYANGTYTVTLKATNVAGASATFEDIIIISIPNPITLPVTFDDPNVAYNAATFSGASFEILDNPDVSGTNDKASKVGAITNSGAAFEGINFDLGTQIDLTTNKTITMNFWADAPVDILMKLEEGTGPDIEVTASHGGTGWEEISFDFNSSNKYVRVTLFVDGPGTTAGTFYIDDIIQIETPAAACTPETTQSLSAADFNLTFQTDPSASIVDADAVLTTVSNPDPDNAVNSSCQVGQIVRNGGALFSNNQIEFDAKIDFNANAGFKMKVWSPVAGTNVLVKLEDKTDSAINVEIGATTTAAGAWEELTFDFASNASGKYDKIILFFELNTNTTETYYIDDFMLYERTGGGEVCTAETTQSLSAADFNLTFMSDPSSSIFEDNTTFEYVDNPGVSSVNNTCKVGKLTNSNQNPWDNMQIDLANKLTFTAGSNFTMKIYSPQSGYKVTLKLEDKNDSGISKEVASTTSTTKTNEWEELTIPFGTDDSGKYDKIVIFFDLETKNANTYYFDDLKLNVGTGGGDTTAPVITLNGDATVNLAVGGAFTDPNATATDDVDGDLSGSITVGGDTVDTNTPGTYVITYNVSDAAGNAATEVTRTVIVATGTTATAPTTGAPIPTEAATDVVSVFSDTYTDIAGVNYNPNWGQSGFGDVDAAYNPGDGNLAIGYLNFNYQGIEFASQDLSQMEFMHVDVWTADATDLKVTPIGGGETLVSLTPLTAGVWNSYDIPVADFTAVNFADVNQIKFDGQGGVNPSNIYVDNIYFYTTGGGGAACTETLLKLPINFDCGSLDYESKRVAGNIDFSIIDNPQLNGVNTAVTKVGEIINKGANWENLNFGLDTPIDFTTDKSIKLKLYSTVSVPIKLKVETGGTPVENDQTHGGTGWEELTFNLATSESFSNIIVFIDGPGTTAGTFYIDDIEQVATAGGGGGGATGEIAENGDFETGDLTGWAVYENNGTIIADNTQSSGGNWSAKLVASPSGMNPTLKQERKATGSIAVGDQVQVTFDYMGSLAGDSGVYDFQAFVEATNGANQVVVFSVTPTATWQTFTTTFTVGAGDVSGGITLQFGAICGGVTGCLTTLYVDNASIIINP